MINNRFSAVVGNDITIDDIADAVELDKLSYPECYRGNVEDCAAWHEKNPDIYVMVRDLRTGHIVAYINAMPVSDECYDMIKDGNFIDIGITLEMILSYDKPGPYHIYLSSVVVHPDYRNTGVFRLLFKAFISSLNGLTERGVIVDKMLADAVSPGGKKFCKLLGMERVGSTGHGSVLYEVTNRL